MPALPDFVELLRARGRRPSVDRVADRAPPVRVARGARGFVRRQLWIDPQGPKEARFQAALDELAEETADGWTMRGRGSNDVGVVTWSAATARRD